jgi:antitoxin PrlF
MEAIVAERGQITLPKAVRDTLGLTKGSKLKVELEGGRIVLRKDVDDTISRVRGRIKLPPGVSTDDIMRELRGRAPGDPLPAWDRPAAGPHSAPAAPGRRRKTTAKTTPKAKKTTR